MTMHLDPSSENKEDVIQFERLDMEVDTTADSVLLSPVGTLKSVWIIGRTKEGDGWYFASNHREGGKALLAMEHFKDFLCNFADLPDFDEEESSDNTDEHETGSDSPFE